MFSRVRDALRRRRLGKSKGYRWLQERGWLWNEMEWQYQCKRKPCCGRWRCLTGKNQTSKINITGKTRLGPQWPGTDGSLLAGSVTNEAFIGQGAKTFLCAQWPQWRTSGGLTCLYMEWLDWLEGRRG